MGAAPYPHRSTGGDLVAMDVRGPAMAIKKTSAVTRGTSALKAAARKVVAKGGSTTKPTTKKSPAAKAATPKKSPAAKKAPARKAPPKKAPVKKAPAKKAPAKKAPALVVRADEKPWTARELAELRGELESDRERLQQEIQSVELGLQELLRDGGDGAGNDQADIGSTTLERDAEMSLANNTRGMLFQVQRALGRLDDGTYGVCESCGNPIGKLRLMAFPRATLCLTCKQREERR
jgi:DnaK suppressor protein